MTNAQPLIAIVDDEDCVRKALDRLMRSVHFSVETYSSGAEFLKSVQTRVPACVVLDLHMPDVNGFEVQAELTRAGMQLPVIIITGHDSPEAKERARGLGAIAYLRKPVDDLKLLDAINLAISGEPDSSGESGFGPGSNGA